MQLTYLGTNALLLRKAGSTILIDPHFSRPSLLRLLSKISPEPKAIASGLTNAGIESLDGLLLTHTHYDHALDAVEVLRQAGGTLYGSASALNLVKCTAHDELPCIIVNPGKVYSVGRFQVRFHLSRHVPFPKPFNGLMPDGNEIGFPLGPSAWFWNYQCGTVFAIQADHLLIFGSAGFIPGSYRDLGVEFVVLSVGGLDLKPASYLDQFYQEAVVLPSAKQVYLSHWDNFFRPVDNEPQPHILAQRSIERLMALGARHGHKVQLLKHGQTLAL